MTTTTQYSILCPLAPIEFTVVFFFPEMVIKKKILLQTTRNLSWALCVSYNNNNNKQTVAHTSRVVLSAAAADVGGF